MPTYLALQSKWPAEKSRLRQRASGVAARLSFERRGRVEHYLFENCEVFKVALSALYGDPAKSLRAIERIALGYLDKPRCLQHFQMPAQVAVRQSTQMLEGSERQTFRMRYERREQTETRTLVDHAVKSVVSKAVRPQ